MNIKRIPLIIVSICLAVHLWFSNSQLLLATSPEYGLMWQVIAIAYSIIGTWSVMTTKEIKPIIVFAVMDGMAVFLKINPPTAYNIVIGSFYAIYTAYIILITWKMSQVKVKQPSVDLSEKTNEPEQDQPQPKAIEQVTAETSEKPEQLQYTQCMNKVKGMLKGGPTPQKRETALQLCMQLTMSEQPQMMAYINEKLPEEVKVND